MLGGAFARRRSTSWPAFLGYLWMVFCQARAGDEEDARIMVVYGQDLWRNGIFGYGGFRWVPRGFDQDGMLMS